MVGVRLIFPAQLIRMSTLPKLLEHRGQQRFKRRAITNVGDQAQGLAAAGFDVVGGLVDFLLAARGGDDVGAGIGEPKTDGAANAGGASGDDRGFAFKAE